MVTPVLVETRIWYRALSGPVRTSFTGTPGNSRDRTTGGLAPEAVSRSRTVSDRPGSPTVNGTTGSPSTYAGRTDVPSTVVLLVMYHARSACRFLSRIPTVTSFWAQTTASWPPSGSGWACVRWTWSTTGIAFPAGVATGIQVPSLPASQSVPSGPVRSLSWSAKGCTGACHRTWPFMVSELSSLPDADSV